MDSLSLLDKGGGEQPAPFQIFWEISVEDTAITTRTNSNLAKKGSGPELKKTTEDQFRSRPTWSYPTHPKNDEMNSVEGPLGVR